MLPTNALTSACDGRHSFFWDAYSVAEYSVRGQVKNTAKSSSDHW